MNSAVRVEQGVDKREGTRNVKDRGERVLSKFSSPKKLSMSTLVPAQDTY